MLPGFIRSFLHTSTWLFVTSDRMTISHHHNVLVLMVVGARNEQLSEASLDGAVGICALANVVDFLDGGLHVIAFSPHVAQLKHKFDIVTVVQSS